jgi:hypothetical protein
MVLDDHPFIEPIEAGEKKLKVGPLAVEPVSDIGALDGQTFFEEHEQFEEFCEHTKPVRLWLDDFQLFKPFPLYIGHKGWVRGSAQQCRRDAESLWVEASAPIEGGTSGSPVVAKSGKLVAIVSHFNVASPEQKSKGGCPRPLLALPVWICRRILESARARLCLPGR